MTLPNLTLISAQSTPLAYTPLEPPSTLKKDQHAPMTHTGSGQPSPPIPVFPVSKCVRVKYSRRAGIGVSDWMGIEYVGTLG